MHCHGCLHEHHLSLNDIYRVLLNWLKAFVDQITFASSLAKTCNALFGDAGQKGISTLWINDFTSPHKGNLQISALSVHICFNFKACLILMSSW